MGNFHWILSSCIRIVTLKTGHLASLLRSMAAFRYMRESCTSSLIGALYAWTLPLRPHHLSSNCYCIHAILPHTQRPSIIALILLEACGPLTNIEKSDIPASRRIAPRVSCLGGSCQGILDKK